MGKDVKAGYFSVSVDSTPEVSEVDQLTVYIVRCFSLSEIPFAHFLSLN